MKSIWKGSLSFGLVSIRVELYPAIAEHTVGFTLLHEKCQNPIQYQRYCSKCHKVIRQQDIVKGIKLKNDRYFVITQAELKQLKPTKTEAIDIQEFVPIAAINPLYYRDHYYVIPTKESLNAFNLLLAAMGKMDKAAIGEFAMHEKSHVCALQAYGPVLLLNTLHYSYELRDIKTLPKQPTSKKNSKQELALALELIEKLSVKKFDATKYKNTYVHEILKLVQQRQKGIKPKRTKKITHKRSGTLLTTLKTSVASSTRELRAYAKSRS